MFRVMQETVGGEEGNTEAGVKRIFPDSSWILRRFAETVMKFWTVEIFILPKKQRKTVDTESFPACSLNSKSAASSLTDLVFLQHVWNSPPFLLLLFFLLSFLFHVCWPLPLWRYLHMRKEKRNSISHYNPRCFLCTSGHIWNVKEAVVLLYTNKIEIFSLKSSGFNTVEFNSNIFCILMMIQVFHRAKFSGNGAKDMHTSYILRKPCTLGFKYDINIMEV